MSDFARQSRRCRRGLGLIELLTIVAVLIIALGLVVATARHVRASSANELTRKRLQALVEETARLIARDDVDPTLPVPPALDAAAARLGATTIAPMAGPADPTAPAEPAAPSAMAATANLNAVEASLRAFADASADRLRELLVAAAANPAAAADAAASLDEPAAIDSGRRGAALLRNAEALRSAAGLAGAVEVRDAWGRSIALMPRQLPALGIAPDDTPFFVSAGPDGSFLTLADNLYSYDLPALLPRPRGSATTAPARPRGP